MLATDRAEATTAPTTTEETRPIRLLIPTVRRTDYWLPYEDTLRASDLGITRHTTDAELAALVDLDAPDADAYRDDLIRIRDGLRHPRDITDARAWGLHIPVTATENTEELHDDPRKRLGWWWVYDTTRTETRQEREARYLTDRRLIDMKGYARILCRAYITVKDRKFEGDNIRRVLDDTTYRRELAATIAGANPKVTAAEAEEDLLAAAREDILKAMPPRRERAGQSDLWYVCDAIRDGRTGARLNEWCEFNKIKQTGRPRGSKTRNRHTKTTT